MRENFTEWIQKEFRISEDIDAKQYSPLTLAFLGDNVYELVNRTVLVSQANAPVNKLNKKTSALAKAAAQARMANLLLDDLTQEERAIFKRGRNAKSYTMAKNASMHDYRHATGWEALMGYLYLRGEYGRLVFLIHEGQKRLREEEQTKEKK